MFLCCWVVVKESKELATGLRIMLRMPTDVQVRRREAPSKDRPEIRPVPARLSELFGERVLQVFHCTVHLIACGQFSEALILFPARLSELLRVFRSCRAAATATAGAGQVYALVLPPTRPERSRCDLIIQRRRWYYNDGDGNIFRGDNRPMRGVFCLFTFHKRIWGQ